MNKMMSTPQQSFKDQLNNWVQMVKAREAMLFRRVNKHVGRSIMVGSPVTGAPGQPVDKGDLIKSWYQLGDIAAREVSWASNLFYAPIIEDNRRGARLRSKVGGFHSVKLTAHAFSWIIEHELAIVKRAIPDSRGVGSQMRDPQTGRFV